VQSSATLRGRSSVFWSGAADELNTGEVLTLDNDFRTYRWNRTRTFDLLISL